MFSRLQAERRQEALHGVQDDVVAAAGAPAHLLVGGELLAGAGRFGGGDVAQAGQGQVSGGHQCTSSSMASTVMKTSSSSVGRERQAAHLVVGEHVDQVLGAQQHRQLAQVHLRHDHPVVRAQHVAEVARGTG